MPENLLITLPTAPPYIFPSRITDLRDNGTYKEGDTQDFGMFCRRNERIGNTVSCVSGVGSQFFYLDRETGRLGYASLYGALTLGDQRDSVTSKIYNCTKF